MITKISAGQNTTPRFQNLRQASRSILELTKISGGFNER